uniref:hypothetical protein n=1 Tax=Escherichia coli TaxID=562 RepID=UPI001BDCA274
FATTDLSVRFCDACQGGGAYGKTASPWPYLLFAKCLPGIFQEISVPVRQPVPLASGRTTERSESVSEEAEYLLYRIFC